MSEAERRELHRRMAVQFSLSAAARRVFDVYQSVMQPPANV
jgi:hypothetical protein